MGDQQHPDGVRGFGENTGDRSRLDPNSAGNTYRNLPAQQVENTRPRGVPATGSYREINSSNAVPTNTVNVGPVVGHRGQVLLPQAGVATTGRRVASDTNLQASPYNTAPGSTTGIGGQPVTAPFRRAIGTRLPRDGNPYGVVGDPARNRPAPRHILPSAPNSHQPSVDLGTGIRNPRQQQSQPRHLTSYASQEHLSPHRAGTANPCPDINTLSADAPRQPSDAFRLPPVPRSRGNGGQSTTRQVFPGTNPFVANYVPVDQGPRVATGLEAYGGVQAQGTAQGEQPHRLGNTADATSAYGRPTLNTSSAYGHPRSLGQSQTRGQFSAFRQSPAYEQSPAFGQLSAYGASFSSAHGPSTTYNPRSVYGSFSTYGSSGANQFTEPSGSASLTAASEYGPSNNGATSADQSFSAYDSLQSRRDHGLPPHLVGPEPLVPQGPAHRQGTELPSFPTNVGTDRGPRRDQGQPQPAAMTAGTNETRVTQGTSRDTPTSSTKKPSAPSGRTVTSRRRRTPGRINHGEVRESSDGSLRFRAEGAEKWELTTQHEENRREMINWASRFGQYTHPPTRGTHPDDETSYHPNQQHWRFEGHHGWHPSQDSTLYRFQREGSGVLTYTPGPLRWRGRVVLNRENMPITDWRNIPLTCASVIEGGRMEQIQREDGRITNEDFQDRQPARSGNRPLPGLSAMGNRKRRFRENNGLASWEIREGTKRITDLIRGHLSDEQLADNTTRGFDRLTQAELQGVKDANAKSGYFKSRAGKKALPDEEKQRRAQEKQAKSRKRKRDDSDEDSVGDYGDGPDNDGQS